MPGGNRLGSSATDACSSKDATSTDSVPERSHSLTRRFAARLPDYPSWTWAVVGVALVAGVCLRWWLLASSLGAADLDEATVGIQARGFLEGELAPFFATQAYGGTAETGLVAVSLLLFGNGLFALKIVPILLHLIACVLVWRTACRFSESRIAQLIPPIALWMGSAYAVWQSTKERGFYGAAIVLACIVLLLVVRLHERDRALDVGVLGFAAGLSLWTTPILVASVVPPIAWLLVRRPQLVRKVAPAAFGAVLGAAPWIVWNLRNGWLSLESPPSFGAGPVDRFADWTERTSTIAGLSTPWDEARALLPHPLGFGAVVAVTLVATWFTRRSAPGLLLCSFLGFGLLQTFNGLAVAVGPDPRYLYPLLPVMALGLGMAIAGLAEMDRVRIMERVALPGAVAALFALSLWGLVGLHGAAQREQPDAFLASPGLDRVIDVLETRGVNAVTTDVSGHQITFATDGSISASTYGTPRFDDLEASARQSGACTYVMRNGYMDGDERRLAGYLGSAEVAFEQMDLGAFSVFFLDEPVQPNDVPLTTFLGPALQPADDTTEEESC